jgi:hypothetical protein
MVWCLYTSFVHEINHIGNNSEQDDIGYVVTTLNTYPRNKQAKKDGEGDYVDDVVICSPLRKFSS